MFYDDLFINGYIALNVAEENGLTPWENYCPKCGYQWLNDELIEPDILCLSCGSTAFQEFDETVFEDNYFVEERRAIKEQDVEKPQSNQKKHINYYEYIKSLAWKEKAQAVKDRAGGRCQVCNHKGSLNAHHRTYQRLGYEKPEDITVLCTECHNLFHRGSKLAKPQ